MSKKISSMLEIYTGDLIEYTEREHIDAVVNAADPTLMGSNLPGIDREIHRKINEKLLQSGNATFKEKIRVELDEEEGLPERLIRCKRGAAVTTSGYEFCKYVIHVVGPECDGKRKSQSYPWCCTSRCTRTLEDCYCNIMKEIQAKRDIKTVIIPIVGTGNYAIPYKLALRIAMATVGNILMKWQRQDPEYFDYMSLEKIIFCIYSSNVREQNERRAMAEGVLKQYRASYSKGHTVVFQKSLSAQCRYLYEITKYDTQKGYFFIAKWTRVIISIIRMLFCPILFIKDFFGKYDWMTRKAITEIVVFAKLLMPFLAYIFLHIDAIGQRKFVWIAGITVYFMIDTLSYLVCLIILADIQRPSANTIRSMILLLVNYLEVSLEIGLLYYLDNFGKVHFTAAICCGIMTERVNSFLAEDVTAGGCSEGLHYLNTAIKFFFSTLAFGYFANYLKQRKFRSGV